MKKAFLLSLSAVMMVLSLTSGCKKGEQQPTTEMKDSTALLAQEIVSKYKPFKLTADLSALSEKEKQMIPLLIEAAQCMDEIFWLQSYGEKEKTLATITDPTVRQAVEINYGPYDRLNELKPFVKDVPAKPAGANFYPADMTKEELEKSDLPDQDKKSLYSVIQRGTDGKLKSVPYHQFYAKQHTKAAELLKKAAELAEDPGLKKYLLSRAEALLTDKYDQSDIDWLMMRGNGLDVVLGPIETYEDKLFGYRAAHEAYVAVKDKSWTKKLEQYAVYLPELQKNLPVPAEYKKEPYDGSKSELGAYDVIYYAGDCNAGSKTIAVNLPNDEAIATSHGTRRLQFKNAMRAKYDNILLPIVAELTDESQRKNITFDAFFANTMFHEVAHGLGIKKTINGKGMVKDALKELYSAIEEGKADILGLYMVMQLQQKGVLKEAKLEDYFVTFVASIFRSVRFGASSAHGQANMLRINYLMKEGAVVRDASKGTYKVDINKMKNAIASLSEKILKLQGDGDYDGVKKWLAEQGKITPEVQSDLDRLKSKKIPVDVVFEQGLYALGLKK